MKKVCILGAGSWGTALAINCARLNQSVYLWGHNAKHINQLSAEGENSRYLAGHKFPPNLTPIHDITIVSQCDAVLLVVPSHAFRQTLNLIQPYIEQQHIGWAIKGFDKQDNELLSEVYHQFFPCADYAVVAGPSFAKEVASGLPTAITVASSHLDFATRFAHYLHNDSMRTYTSADVIGAQVAGALKNVIAIATGIADGIGYGANTRAALITRGLHEITRIAMAAGAKSETLMGLSGLGDLLLTCTDDQSRNRRLGLLIGQGKTVEQAQALIGQTVEGVNTSQEALKFAEKYHIRAPISEITAQILQGKISASEAAQQLSAPQPKPEIY